MTAIGYHGNTATLSITTDGGTSMPIGWLQNVDITVEAEESEMTACGSIFIQDRRVFVRRVKVKAEINQIDEDLLFDVLAPSGTNVSGGTMTSMEDTNVVSLYDIISSVTDTSGNTLTATVDDVDFKDLPIIIATKDDYVGWPIEGIGVQMALVKA